MPFPFDTTAYRLRSQRRVIFAKNGMVCSSQPLAAQAGLDVLRRGGNAVDAAVATAAALTVVEPTSNGVGGDAFAQIWMDGRLYGLNSSGPAPALADADFLRERFGKVPAQGWYGVNVPGIPAAWAEASRRFGRLPFAELFTSAISYAEDGYRSRLWCLGSGRDDYATFRPLRGETEIAPWFDTFTVDGKAPRAGQIVKLPELGQTLRELASTDCESFYRGELARRIDDWSRRSGGWLRYDDLAAYQPEWVEPMSVDYRGYRVWELPPNGHGIVVLMTLGILSGFERLDGGYGERAPRHRGDEAGICRREALHSRQALYDLHGGAAALPGISGPPTRPHRPGSARAHAGQPQLRRHGVFLHRRPRRQYGQLDTVQL